MTESLESITLKLSINFVQTVKSVFFVCCYVRIVPYLVEECQGLDGDVEANKVHQFVHRLHLLVQLGGVQDGVGKSSVDPSQERFHQLCVNLAFLDRHGEEGEVYLDEFSSKAEKYNI